MDSTSLYCRLQEAGEEDVGVNRDNLSQNNMGLILNPKLRP